MDCLYTYDVSQSIDDAFLDRELQAEQRKVLLLRIIRKLQNQKLKNELKQCQQQQKENQESDNLRL